MMKNTQENQKKSVGFAAAELVKEAMVVGLGTGSTANYFIEAIGEKVAQGMKIEAIATSKNTERLAQQYNIPLTSLNSTTKVDLVVDGADEITPEKQMIKGGGGALLQEKIVAEAANTYVIIVDSSKVVSTLGAFPLPIEVTQYGWQWTKKHLEALGLPCRRRQKEGSPFITDCGNYILDATLSNEDIFTLNQKIINTVGVVETGLFLHMADKVLVGTKNGVEKLA